MTKVIVRCVNNKKDIAVRTTSELVDMMLDARKELDASRAKAEDLHMELMERDFRVDELEKQIEWLRSKNEEWAQVANNQKNIIEDLRKEVEHWKRIASENVDMAKQFHHETLVVEEEAKRLKDSHDALYEQSASNHANAECREENEEEYDNLRKMYIELRDAAAAAVAASHIRSNTVAN